MKGVFEINKNKAVKSIDEFNIAEGVATYRGEIQFKGDKRTFIFIMSMNEPIGKQCWEHVSVHIAGTKDQLPAWSDMCKVKDIFWNKDEEVHQLHPSEKCYIHETMGYQNILHLWRPVGGWKEFGME